MTLAISRLLGRARPCRKEARVGGAKRALSNLLTRAVNRYGIGVLTLTLHRLQRLGRRTSLDEGWSTVAVRWDDPGEHQVAAHCHYPGIAVCGFRATGRVVP